MENKKINFSFQEQHEVKPLEQWIKNIADKKNVNTEILKKIDNKFLRVFGKLLRYHPDPINFNEPINGNKISLSILSIYRDKSFIKTLSLLGIFNAICETYVNYQWVFKFYFSDNYRIEIKISKYGSNKDLKYSDAVKLATEEAVHTHEVFKQKQLLEDEEKINDIIYED